MGLGFSSAWRRKALGGCRGAFSNQSGSRLQSSPCMLAIILCRYVPKLKGLRYLCSGLSAFLAYYSLASFSFSNFYSSSSAWLCLPSCLAVLSKTMPNNLILYFQLGSSRKGLSSRYTSNLRNLRSGSNSLQSEIILCAMLRYSNDFKGIRQFRVPWRLLLERSRSTRWGSTGKFSSLRRSHLVMARVRRWEQFWRRSCALGGMNLMLKVEMMMVQAERSLYCSASSSFIIYVQPDIYYKHTIKQNQQQTHSSIRCGQIHWKLVLLSMFCPSNLIIP